MCGIVGFRVGRHYSDFREDLRPAVNSLAHRGPDDAGIFLDDESRLGLGHRRLSIIDLSPAGRQPMESAAGDAVIVYNGELYNFRHLRDELAGLGHRFRSRTDTEVVLNAYLQWGTDCLEKFVGMFAFAIWDRRSRRLFAARDRLGIKPLYYHHKGGSFLFASELKALAAFRRFPRRLDPRALPLFLHYQYVPAPRSIFEDTFKLPPGHFLLFAGGTLTVSAYWQLPAGENDAGTGRPVAEDEDAVLDRLDGLLTRAVADRLISDVPLGALLSGGIDSSLVVALMQKTSASPVRTFSIGFSEAGYDEAPWAARVAGFLGTRHTELYVDPRQALAIIPRLPEIYDEPFADSSAVPTFLVSRLTRGHVTVALSGDGGDEQFAGYVRYWMTRSMERWFAGIPMGLRRPLAAALDRLPPSWVEACYLPLRDRLPQRLRVANVREKWQKLVDQVGENRLAELYRMTICLWPQSELRRLMGGGLPRSGFEAAFDRGGRLPVLKRLMRVDQHTYLPDCMLTKVDRASMANSLEIRVPLLDHRVVEFTAALPERLLYRHGTGKYLLKRLLARYLPDRLFDRPKAGFGVPIEQWLRGDLKELMLDYLSPRRLEQEGLFDAAVVQHKIREHLDGTGSHHYRLWALMMWEMWRERWPLSL